MADALTPSGPESSLTRRKSRRSVHPDSLPSTEIGERVAQELRERIISMFDREALVWANRRRATSIDSNDFERAYDEIINPIPRPDRLDLVADVCNVGGGIFLGYAINILTNEQPDYTRFGLSGLAGVFLCGVTVALKNLRLKR